ncbi:MAG: hypothetical protein V7711_11660 [Pseudomonadales bacterium]
MTSSRISTLVFCLLCLWVPLSLAQTGTEPTAQSEPSEVRVKAWLEPSEGIISSQQVKLVIELSTDRWFTAGTRIGLFEVKDAVVLRRESFAVNSTRNKGGQTWVTQQWDLTVYPQRSGDLLIPAIPLTVTVAEEGGSSTVRQLTTKQIAFSAQAPAELVDVPQWVATSRLRVVEEYNQSLDQLEAGDAVVRTITLNAEGVAAMMLPATGFVAQDGLAIYQTPPQVEDQNNRGIYLAQRIDQLTYVIERPGSYTLPELSYYWWDLSAGRVRIETLASQQLVVGGVIPAVVEDPTAPAVSVWSWQKIGFVLLSLCLVLILIVGMVWLRSWLVQRRSTPSAAALRQQIARDLKLACSANDKMAVIRLMYQWLDGLPDDRFKGEFREALLELDTEPVSGAFEQLMANCYGDNSLEPDLKDFAQQLIECFGERETNLLGSLLKPVELRLN